MKKEKYLQIAQNGTADEFREAYNRVAHAKFASTKEKRRLMTEKAIEALQEGRPENMQAVIAKVNDLYFMRDTLDVMAKKCTDLSGAIDRSFNTIPEANRREFLTDALHYHLLKGVNQSDFTCDEKLVSDLLKSGADANNNGDNMAMASRILNNPKQILKILHENGGSFADGIKSLRKSGYGIEQVERLRHYEEQIINPPAPEKTVNDVLETLQQIQAQMTDMSRRIDALGDKIDGRQQAGPVVKPTRQPYPSV